MNDRIFVVREAITKLVPMLTDKKVVVTQRGISAFVKADASGRPVQVNLPYIPDNASEELVDAIQGFLDHEVAHILFTDFKVVQEAANAGVHSMLNIIEDARIEKAMAKRFRGSATNINNTAKFFLEKFTIPKMEEAIAAGDEATLTGVLMVPLIRGMAGQSLWKDFMSDKMHHVQETYDKIKHLEDDIAEVTSTAEVLKVTKGVIKAIDGREVHSAPPPAPMPMPKGGGSGKASKSSKGSSSGVAGAAPAPDEDDSSAGGADEEESTADASSEPDEEEEATAAPAADEEEEDEDGEPAAPAARDESLADEGDDGSNEDIADTSTGTGMSWDEIDKNMAGDFDDTASNLITNGMAGACKNFCVNRGHEIIPKGICHDRYDDHEKAAQKERTIPIPS